MLYTSEGLTFGHQPNALGLRMVWRIVRWGGELSIILQRICAFGFQKRVASGVERAAAWLLVARYSLYYRLMRAVLQRVTQASVFVDGQIVGEIGKGYLLLLAVMDGDTESNANALVEKVVRLRLFDGEDGKVNDRSLLDISGEILVVSQFTLAGRTEKGNRPDYTAAAAPADAERLYGYVVERLRSLGVSKVETGRFGAMMQVSLTNDGPVTLVLDR
jgi:D-aminoacyl-tRNA deacylase